METTRNYEIIKYKKNERLPQEDTVIVEYPLVIFLNDRKFITLLCTPKSLGHLAVGFLYSEGIINSRDDIRSLRLDEENGRAYVYTENKDVFAFNGDQLFGSRTVTTACGKERTISYNVIDFLGTASDKIDNPLRLNPGDLLNLLNTFNRQSHLFSQTGGVHSCALGDKNGIIIFQEDVGRHNALDKILGEALLTGLDLSDKIIATSGRISSEMAIKVIKRKIPFLISRSAPTNLAVDLANKFNLTLIGFARGDKMNVYSGFSRLSAR